MIGDRQAGKGAAPAASAREERLALLLELRRVRAGLHSPAVSEVTRHRIRRALLERAYRAAAPLFVALRVGR